MKENKNAITYKRILDRNLQHPSSSDPFSPTESLQSSTSSQVQRRGTHFPLPHWKSESEQVVSAEKK